MEPVVSFREAVCLLGRFPALAGVDLDVGAGEIVLLQGPNGAGKTTVLRALAGLQPLDRGHIEVSGRTLDRPDGAVFSGDHVMAWASTVVSPPNGDMAQYCASLRLLRTGTAP